MQPFDLFQVTAPVDNANNLHAAGYLPVECNPLFNNENSRSLANFRTLWSKAGLITQQIATIVDQVEDSVCRRVVMNRDVAPDLQEIFLRKFRIPHHPHRLGLCGKPGSSLAF